MPKKHSFRRPRRWLLRRPGVVAKPPPEVHAMMAKDRNRGSSARRCDPAAAATAFDIRGNRNARSWPSPTHLAVSGTCAAPRNDRCAGWRYSLRGTGIPNVAEARTGTRRVGGWLPRAALTNAWRQLGREYPFYSGSATAFEPGRNGPANGTSNSPTSAAPASMAQASLVLRANAAFSTMGRT
jgi:hypothetical protein